jgi:NosR/NirI family nitrous oxide reductase transcriptional regulator
MEQELIIEKQSPKINGQPAGHRRGSKPNAVSKINKERIIAAISIFLIITAWLIGIYRGSTDIKPYLHQTTPTADRIAKTTNGNFAAYNNDQLLGYIAIGEGSGYGGPMQLAVATNIKGTITGLVVVKHFETPRWFERVFKNGLISRLIGKSYSDKFNLNSDIDGVSGATYTSRGIANATLDGSRKLAKQELNFSVPPRAATELVFGLPEIALIALFILGIVGRRKSFRHTKKMRWFCMLTGMIMLGFVYTNPLTISLLNKMLLGYWPDWHTHLYWYLLIVGIIFSMTVFNKNPYCEWFCPFGAAQECMGKVGGAKAHTLRTYQSKIQWLQRCLAFGAVLIALLYRNPSISSYEIFGTLFDLDGNITQFLLLGLILLASLFIHRPWCRYLCPIKPVESFIKFIKNWTKDLWMKIRLRRKI